MTKSKIEWTEQTWNPIVGCSIVSPGCTNCYAMKMAARLECLGNAPQYNGLTKKVNGKVVWTGKVALAEKALLKPLKRRKPTTYFVNSMGDLFHEDVPDDWIDRAFAVMALCPQHTFQVLTKRADRMQEYVCGLDCEDARRFHVVKEIETIQQAAHVRSETSPSRNRLSADQIIEWNAWAASSNLKAGIGNPCWPLPNVWLGVSAEDQTRADERIPQLLNTPAAVRFVSCEPLLGSLDLSAYLRSMTWGLDLSAEAGGGSRNGVRPGLDWIIVGGESGPKARPMHPDWARGLRSQCEAAGTAFFFKQWGEWQPVSEMGDDKIEALYHPAPVSRPDANQRGKHDSICLDLDGTTYSMGTAGKLACCPAGAFAGPKPMSMFRVGKASAGRLLDGREWNGVPA